MRKNEGGVMSSLVLVQEYLFYLAFLLNFLAFLFNEFIALLEVKKIPKAKEMKEHVHPATRIVTICSYIIVILAVALKSYIIE